MDLYWPQWCIVEMKAPSRAERLSTHYQQVRDYWEASADDVAGTPAARFVVLCAFHRFEIWEPGRFPRSPRVIVDLQDLPDRYDVLAFLSGPGVEPSYVEHHRVLTTGAAKTVAMLFERLVDWPGDAKVHVSLTNWVKSPTSPPALRVLDGAVVEGITSRLTSGGDQPAPAVLSANAARAFIGCYARHPGFQVESDSNLLADETALAAGVVRPWLAGDDVTSRPDQSPARWTVDFGSRSLDEAAAYPAALAQVRARVRPDRTNDPAQLRYWWLFWRPRAELRSALARQRRFVAIAGTGKRLLMAWQPATVCPSHGIVVVAVETDHEMGILLSRAHGAWAWARSSTLETRLRYTPSSVFETFPWPDPLTKRDRDRVADVCRRLLARRSGICANEQIGLTTLYNAVDDGAWTDLAALHRELDEVVARCYGWPVSVAQDDAELVRRLSALNTEIAAGRPYEPFGD